ncbi:DUF2599 domain-containing protein [Cellulosimicrobium cellulans]|uniref:DUF2599 domain-containing protein n=1 Tax=Cellulosimicrobium cellulans TaxID=1710 RepID=UPI0036E8DC6D
MTPPARAGARRRSRVTARALATGVLALAVLAGCTPDGGASSPSPGTVPTTRADGAPGEPGEPGEPGHDGTAEAGGDTTAEPEVVRVPSGSATVEITAPALTSTAEGGGAPAVAVSAGDEGTSNVALVLADAPALVSVEDGSLVRHPDGTLTVLDDAGTPVGGLDAPRVVGPHGAQPGDATALGDAPGDEGAITEEPSPGTPGVRSVLVDARHAEVILVPAAGTSSGTSSGGTGADGDGPVAPWDVVVPLGTRAVRTTDWGEREGGRSLAVDPTAWARAAGQAGQELVWAQVVAAEPEVDTPTMHDQLVCHAVGAPDKATWNLEPWRPDVGLLATMAARCNPT